MENATESAVSDVFNKKSILATAPDSLQLANIIVAYSRERVLQNLIFFCGNLRNDSLPEILTANHIPFIEHIVYQTVKTPILISEYYHGILFFSPSAVQSFFSINTVPLTTILFSIGHTTARELAKYTNNQLIISEEPSKKKLLEMAIKQLIYK